MYSMNHTGIRKNISLISRNEGKIKSYESCFDIRAWCHDVRIRDRYLREWIKCDMPACFIPICTLTSFLKIMTCKSRGKTTPRCHPDCKSKFLLESICTSCHAIKECLKANRKFDKYIEEEEFQTSHWPCERCLDALKNIKIFWRIIVEKLFNIKFGKSNQFDTSIDNFFRVDGVKSIAKIWERDMVQQAIFVKNVAPVLNDSSSLHNIGKDKCRPLRNEIHSGDKFYNLKNTINSESIPKEKNVHYKVKGQNSKILNVKNDKSIVPSKSFIKKSPRKLSRSISVKVKTAEVACSTYNIERENEELNAHKANLKYLQNKFDVHKIEIERLRQENLLLKSELQNSRKSQCGKPGSHTIPIPKPDKHATTLQSIENNTDGEIDSDSTKNIASEMIITMKNCQNKSFKHVSLLQVLHKTNNPAMVDMSIDELVFREEDPVNLLNKVQTTFGAIVKREISVVAEKQTRSKWSDIEATFRRVNTSRSMVSCSTVSASSESNFLSTKTTSDKFVPFDM